MSLTNNDILKLAKLSRLKINNEDKQYLLDDLNNIFKMIEIMEEVDTSDIEPLSHPHDLYQRLREDFAVKVENNKECQKNAPMLEEGFYMVPKVIE